MPTRLDVDSRQRGRRPSRLSRLLLFLLLRLGRGHAGIGRDHAYRGGICRHRPLPAPPRAARRHPRIATRLLLARRRRRRVEGRGDEGSRRGLSLTVSWRRGGVSWAWVQYLCGFWLGSGVSFVRCFHALEQTSQMRNALEPGRNTAFSVCVARCGETPRKCGYTTTVLLRYGAAIV